MEEKKLAKQFHDTYERLAPQFGYETREDTKEFEEDSPNGKLMIAVCKEVMLKELDRAREETRQEERDMFIVRYATVSFNEVIKTIKTLSIIEFLSIKWGLKGKKKSKLTTK